MKGAFYLHQQTEKKLGMTGQEFLPLLLENAKLPLFGRCIRMEEEILDHYVRTIIASDSYENVVEGCKKVERVYSRSFANKPAFHIGRLLLYI